MVPHHQAVVRRRPHLHRPGEEVAEHGRVAGVPLTHDLETGGDARHVRVRGDHGPAGRSPGGLAPAPRGERSGLPLIPEDRDRRPGGEAGDRRLHLVDVVEGELRQVGAGHVDADRPGARRRGRRWRRRRRHRTAEVGELVRRIEHRAVIEADRVRRIRHSPIAEDPQEVVAGGQIGETQPLAVVRAVGQPEDAAGRVEQLHVDVTEGVLERHHHVARRGPRGEQREGVEVDVLASQRQPSDLAGRHDLAQPRRPRPGVVDLEPVGGDRCPGVRRPDVRGQRVARVVGPAIAVDVDVVDARGQAAEEERLPVRGAIAAGDHPSGRIEQPHVEVAQGGVEVERDARPRPGRAGELQPEEVVVVGHRPRERGVGGGGDLGGDAARRAIVVRTAVVRQRGPEHDRIAAGDPRVVAGDRQGIAVVGEERQRESARRVRGAEVVMNGEPRAGVGVVDRDHRIHRRSAGGPHGDLVREIPPGDEGIERDLAPDVEVGTVGDLAVVEGQERRLDHLVGLGSHLGERGQQFGGRKGMPLFEPLDRDGDAVPAPAGLPANQSC